MGHVKGVIAIPCGTIYNHVSEPHCITVLNVLAIIQLDGEVPLTVRHSICSQTVLGQEIGEAIKIKRQRHANII